MRRLTGPLVAVLMLASLTAASGRPVAVPLSLRIMTIGDSLNTGLGSPDGCGYRTELARLMLTANDGVAVVTTFTGLANGSNPNDCPIPYGHFGSTVQDVKNSAAAWTVADTPDVVLVQVGTNNAMGSMANFQADYQTMLTNILNASPTVKVVASYVPYSVAPWAANEVTANIAIIMAVLALLPTYGSSRLYLINASKLPCKFMGDGMHPWNYDPMGRWYYEALAALYGFTPVPLNSYYFLDQPRPGYERSPTVCPA